MLYPIELWVRPFICRSFQPAKMSQLDDLILILDTASMKRTTAAPDNARLWQKTQFSNLIRYSPSGTYFARLRVNGKLIRKTLKTDVLSVAQLHLTHFEKFYRQHAATHANVNHGNFTFVQPLPF